MAYVMHGGKKNAPPYKLFCETCAKAFNILRKHSRILIILFQLMIPAGEYFTFFVPFFIQFFYSLYFPFPSWYIGIPELTCDEDIEYMKNKLHLELTDEQAGKLIKKKLRNV